MKSLNSLFLKLIKMASVLMFLCFVLLLLFFFGWGFIWSGVTQESVCDTDSALCVAALLVVKKKINDDPY